MTSSVLPESFVDAISVVAFLSGESLAIAPDSARRPVGEGEVHLFAYLGCLLGLYRQQPSANWGYVFVRTNAGLPFSESLSAALEVLIRGGLIEHFDVEGYFLTPRGRDMLKHLGGTSLMRERVELIQTACDAAITIPPTRIRLALSGEPGLSVASNRALYTTLGAEGALETLYEQFKTLHRVIAVDVSNLLVPALAWLTYLADMVTETATFSGAERGG